MKIRVEYHRGAGSIVNEPNLKPDYEEVIPSSETILNPDTQRPFTPDSMMHFIANNPAPFKRHWQDVQALYLQEPNITIKKTAPTNTPIS